MCLYTISTGTHGLSWVYMYFVIEYLDLQVPTGLFAGNYVVQPKQGYRLF